MQTRITANVLTRHATWRRACVTLAAAALLLAAELAAAAAGKVLFVSGTVQVERGTTRALAAGDAIEVGDVIVTGEASRAQLLMADGAKVALRAATRFRIDAMTLPDSVTAPGQARATTTEGSSAATLLKGGFRTVTGSVGKTNPAGYQVRTPVGVLGIRGTDYAVVFCNGDCPDPPGTRDGLYLGVYTTGTGGGIVFRPDGGTPFNLDPGQFSFLPLNQPTPQPLQVPPPILQGDPAGPLVVGTLTGGGLAGGGGAPGAADGGTGIGEFGNRRGPAGGPDSSDPGRSGPDSSGPTAAGLPPTVNQPIGATDDQGNPVDLTDGGADTRAPQGGEQYLAYGVGNFGSFGFNTNANEQGGALVTDGNGNATAFAATVAIQDVPTPGTIAIGTSSNNGTGADAGTGLRWGRWSGGAAQVTTATGGGPVPLATQSLHWIFESARDEPGVLPITGQVNYVLVGGTAPTDTAGNSGALGAAFLSANFTDPGLQFALRLTIDQVDWFAAGPGGFTAGGPRFSGIIEDATIGGNAFAIGLFNGFLVPGTDAAPGAPAAGVAYTLIDQQGNRAPVSGVVGFATGSGVPLGPPAERRDVSFSIGILGQEFAFTDVAVNAPQEYAQDAQLDLTLFAAGFPTGSAPLPASYAIGSSTVAESGADSLTLLRWGRWSGGTAEVTPDGQPSPTPIELVNRSLHWIVSGNAPNAPVLPVAGTVNYTLIGGTNPTDDAGNVGTLGTATFTADFNNQSVDSTLALSAGPRDWSAAGTGPIGAQAGLPAHQFGGSYNVTGTNTANGQPFSGFGTFSGFFSGPGDPTVPGVPGGAGLSYSLLDDTDNTIVQGTAAFGAP
jgi:hypothetical protein